MRRYCIAEPQQGRHAQVSHTSARLYTLWPQGQYFSFFSSSVCVALLVLCHPGWGGEVGDTNSKTTGRETWSHLKGPAEPLRAWDRGWLWGYSTEVNGKGSVKKFFRG